MSLLHSLCGALLLVHCSLRDAFAACSTVMLCSLYCTSIEHSIVHLLLHYVSILLRHVSATVLPCLCCPVTYFLRLHYASIAHSMILRYLLFLVTSRCFIFSTPYESLYESFFSCSAKAFNLHCYFIHMLFHFCTNFNPIYFHFWPLNLAKGL